MNWRERESTYVHCGTHRLVVEKLELFIDHKWDRQANCGKFHSTTDQVKASGFQVFFNLFVWVGLAAMARRIARKFYAVPGLAFSTSGA